MTGAALPCCRDCGEALEDAERLKVCPYCGSILVVVDPATRASELLPREPLDLMEEPPADLLPEEREAWEQGFRAVRIGRNCLVLAALLEFVQAVIPGILGQWSLAPVGGAILRMLVLLALFSASASRPRTVLGVAFGLGLFVALRRTFLVLRLDDPLAITVELLVLGGAIALLSLIGLGARAARNLEERLRDRSRLAGGDEPAP